MKNQFLFIHKTSTQVKLQSETVALNFKVTNLCGLKKIYFQQYLKSNDCILGSYLSNITYPKFTINLLSYTRGGN